MNGLNIDTQQFSKLPQKQQLIVLYDNTEELKALMSGFKFQQKVQWFVIVILAAWVGVAKFLGVL